MAVHVGVVFGQEAEGNLTNDGRWSYVWDAENRLIQMTVNTNVGPQYQLTFAYDPQGRRIEKIVLIGGVPQSTNLFLYDGWNLIGELAPNDSLIRSYVWGNDLSGSQQGAGGVGGLVEMSYAGTNCFVAYDGNGNVAAMVNAGDGTVVANYEYGPFGEVIRATGPLAKANPFRFSTKYQDNESDLLYYGYRYYDRSTGKWLSRDLIEERGGENLFGFIQNKALTSVDPIGLATLRFTVVEGSPLGWFRGAGKWSQPWWAGYGDYEINSSSAWSLITLNNAPSSWDTFYFTANYCNTVWWQDPIVPDFNVGNAGAIKVYLKDECGGRFHVDGLYTATLFGAGPAEIYATAYFYAGDSRLLNIQTATQQTSVAYAVAWLSEDVILPANREVLIAHYEPKLVFLNRIYYNGTSSFASIDATIWINSVTKE